MLRFMTTFLVATVVSGTAMGADRALPHKVSHHVWHRTAVILPARLARPHYRFRTTISYRAAYVQPAVPRLSVYENPRALYAPSYTEISYIEHAIRAPLIPRYSTLPGYYGPIRSYDYEEPYSGGPYVGYWDGVPYACGAYGYC